MSDNQDPGQRRPEGRKPHRPPQKAPTRLTNGATWLRGPACGRGTAWQIQKRSTTNYRKGAQADCCHVRGQVVSAATTVESPTPLRLCLDSTRTIGEVRGEIKGEQERVSVVAAAGVQHRGHGGVGADTLAADAQVAPTPDGMYETGVQLVQSAIRASGVRDRLRADVLGGADGFRRRRAR